MHSFAIVATAIAFAAGIQAQSFANGGVGRFSCTTNGAADPTQCTQAAMTNSQLCPPPARLLGVVDGGNKENGVVPTSATCIAGPRRGEGFFCGIAGAACITGANCDNGACVNSVCTGGLGAACTADSQCTGSLYCTTPGNAVVGFCGGVGAACADFCIAGNFLCASNLCDGNTGQCVLPNTVGVSQRARSRRATTLTERGAHCPTGQLVCALEGSVRGFECVDPLSNLEQCGACAAEGGMDCTSLPGVDAVGCVEGRCEIWACSTGFAWSAASAGCEPAL